MSLFGAWHQAGILNANSISFVDTYIFNNQKDLSFSDESVKEIASEVIALEGVAFDEAAVHFVDESTICALHKRYFDDSSPTDCISFPMDNAAEEGYKVLGEIFVCPKAALTYAAEHKNSPYDETTLYVVHGLLHLMGYDDMNEADRAKMRKAEDRHMENLKHKGLILK